MLNEAFPTFRFDSDSNDPSWGQQNQPELRILSATSGAALMVLYVQRPAQDGEAVHAGRIDDPEAKKALGVSGCRVCTAARNPTANLHPQMLRVAERENGAERLGAGGSGIAALLRWTSHPNCRASPARSLSLHFPTNSPRG